MTTNIDNRPDEAILEDLRDTRNALSVGRVIGEPSTVDGVTIVPVARVVGGAGGGGGEGNGPDQTEGKGFGTGFGMAARGLGVYELRDGQLNWKPAIDVDRLIRGFQVLAGVLAVCVTVVRLRRGSRER